MIRHTIRLGEPWERTELPDGGVRHLRRFGRPRTLDADERLVLVCEHLPGTAVVRVNGVSVGCSRETGAFRADITEQLQTRNVVEIDQGTAGPLGHVVLTISQVTRPD